MGNLVTPRVYFIGESVIIPEGLTQYLEETGNQKFLDYISEARAGGLKDGEILTSFYAKLCYASLHEDTKNKNISRVRDIVDNLAGTINQGHLSVWEHCQLNFVITDCSRVFTHELCRHRVGTAFSQTSGRYVRTDSVDLVFDPILNPVKELATEAQSYIENIYLKMVDGMGLNDTANPIPMDEKKRITSALRRVLFNGQSNEMGFSTNIRALRHLIQIRTSGGAEWEIRDVFAQVYELVKAKYPMIFYGAKERTVRGIKEVYGMKMQPYDEVTTK